MGISWIFEIISATVEYHKSPVKYLWQVDKILSLKQYGLILNITNSHNS